MEQLNFNESDKLYLQKQLSDAIEDGNRPAIVKYLREISNRHSRPSDALTSDLILKLASYLDPNRKPLKVGPKPKRFYEKSLLIGPLYYYLMKHKDWARYVLNQDNEAFELIEGTSSFDGAGNFAPQWKYPHATRKRENTPFPDGDDITEIVCKEFGICKRELDNIKARYNKRKRK